MSVAEAIPTGDAPSPYTVVVGVSDTSKSPVALQWAVGQAERHDGRVLAVRAYRVTPSGPSVRPSGIARDEASEDAAALDALRADVDSVLGAGNDVSCVIVPGGRLKVLVEAAEHADLLVVDAPRATNLLSGQLLANRLVYRASCPVVIMPPGISGEPPSWFARAMRTLGSSVVAAAGTSGRPGGRMMPLHTDGDSRQ